MGVCHVNRVRIVTRPEPRRRAGSGSWGDRITPAAMRRLAFIPLLLPLVCALSCAGKRQTDLHWERAHDIILKERTLAEGQPDYTDPVWLDAIEELSQVDPRFVRYQEALALMEEIKDSRAAAFRAEAERLASERRENERGGQQAGEEFAQDQGDPFQRAPTGPDQGRWELEIQEVSAERHEGRFAIEGRVRNLSGRTLENPLVLVFFLDGKDGIVRTAQAMLDPAQVPAGGFGTFSLDTRDDSRIRRYRLQFRELAGSELALKDSSGPATHPAP